MIREAVNEKQTKEMNEWILKMASKHSDDQGKLDENKLTQSIYDGYDLSQLQHHARSRGLKPSGKKKDIIKQILASIQSEINKVVEVKKEKMKSEPSPKKVASTPKSLPKKKPSKK